MSLSNLPPFKLRIFDMGQYPSVASQPENGNDELFRKTDAEKLLILIDARRAEDQLATNKYIEEVTTTNFYNQVLLVALGTTAYYGMKTLRQYFNIKVFQSVPEHDLAQEAEYRGAGDLQNLLEKGTLHYKKLGPTRLALDGINVFNKKAKKQPQEPSAEIAWLMLCSLVRCTFL